MKAKIVVGLGFGDEGKGITTDYLAAKDDSSIVVRYSGGHQAGHTVVSGDTKHTFSSFCSGSLLGKESYISEHCCFYPTYMIREENILKNKVSSLPTLNIHPLAKMTTPYDIALNHYHEMKKGHGSVGVGVGVTMKRNEGPYKIHAIDLKNPKILNQKLKSIESYFVKELEEASGSQMATFHKTLDEEMKYFLRDIRSLKVNIVGYDYLKSFKNVIFEGSQGVLLDMDHGVFPNVTYGNTTSKNAISICKQLGITDVDIYYVTRCYTTRHGNGWMPNNDPIILKNVDESNVYNEWQGEFKTGEIDFSLLQYAIDCDDIYSSGFDKNLVVTCLDQREGFVFDLGNLDTKFKTVTGSYSSHSKDFKRILTQLK